jgi:hypothetical protein
MSLACSIIAQLKADFSKDTIKNILENGNRIGLLYHPYDINNCDACSHHLNGDQILTAIYNAYETSGMYCIVIEFDKAYFNLHFMNKNNQLIVMIPRLNPLWSKVYKNHEEDIDIERYLKIFLSLIHNYQILDMHVEYD